MKLSQKVRHHVFFLRHSAEVNTNVQLYPFISA